jgi:hypothetical protein
MAHTFGTYTVDIIQGTPPESLREAVEVWGVPGHDGSAAIKKGKPPVTFPLTLVRFGSQATIETWIANIEATQGTIVSVVYDSNAWNDTYNYILVKGCSIPERQKVKYQGSTQVRARIDVQCVLTQDQD